MCNPSVSNRTGWGRSVSAVVIVAVAVGLASCSKNAASADPAPTGATPVAANSAAAPKACNGANPKAATESADTISVLRRLDRARTQGYKPSFELPTRPTETPCQTTFAKAPAKDEYDAAFRRIERNLGAFTAEFEKQWGRIQLGPTAPGAASQLASAVVSEGAVPAVAACQVVDVTGGCSRKCVNGDTMMAEFVCRDGGPDGWWAYSCVAKASCTAEAPLTNSTAGLEYTANEYVVEFRAAAVKEPAMREFRSQVEKLKVGNGFRVPISAWRFNKTWIADADLSAGAPTVIE